MQARGKTKEVLKAVSDMESLVSEAIGCIDTKDQYKIRYLLEKALERAQDERDKYDPM